MIDIPPEPPPYEEQIIEHRLVECGLDAEGISVQYDDDLQSFEIVIRPSAGATADHFKCIKEATGYATVTFEDREVLAAYFEFSSEFDRPQLLSELESKLRERSLWESFPDRQDHNSMEDYVRALEEQAGLAPGSALRVSDDGMIFDPPRDALNHADFRERIPDLLRVIWYASTKERLELGFIGGELEPK